MTRDQKIEALLQNARNVAVTALDGRQATTDNLAALAAAAREEILAQADRGEWSAWGVTDSGGLLNLTAEAVRNSTLVGPPIRLIYDFSGTRLKSVVTM